MSLYATCRCGVPEGQEGAHRTDCPLYGGTIMSDFHVGSRMCNYCERSLPSGDLCGCDGEKEARFRWMDKLIANGVSADLPNESTREDRLAAILAVAIEDHDSSVGCSMRDEHWTNQARALLAESPTKATPSALSGDNSQSSSNAGGVDPKRIEDCINAAIGHGEHGIFVDVAKATGSILASLSTPTAEPPPTPDRIGKDAVREALKPFADKASMCDFGSDDYCPDWSPFIPVGAYRNAARALSATPAQEGEQ